MFLSKIISVAANTLKSFFGGSTSSKAMAVQPAKIASAPAPMAKIPALSVAPIVNWGESASSLKARTTEWQTSGAKASQDQYFVDLQKWQMAEDARKLRVATEGKISVAKDKNTQKLSLGAVAPQQLTPGTAKQQQLTLAKNPHEGFANQSEKDSFDVWFSKQSPEEQARVTEYNKVKNEYRKRATKIVEQYKVANQTNNFWNWFTGGWSSDEDARKFAEKNLKSLSEAGVTRYEKKLSDFLTWQAKNKQILEKSKVSSEEEYQQALSVWNQQDSFLKDLNYTKAAMEGSAEAYGTKASEASASAIGQVISGFQNIGKAINENPFGRYTLGSGDQTWPSLVTAPGRVVNWLGNLIDSKGTKNYRDGTSTQGLPAGKNPWQATYDQRNWNVGNRIEFKESDFQSWYKKQNLSQWEGDIKSGKLDPKKVEKLYRDRYKGGLDTNGNVNDVIDFFGDPIAAIPGGKIASSLKVATGATKFGAWLERGVTKLGESKAVQWLGKEYKSPELLRSDAIRESSKIIEQKQRDILPKIKAYADSLRAGGSSLDTKVISEMMDLTDSEWEILSRVKNGKISSKDRIAYWTPSSGLGTHPTLKKLEDIASRWESLYTAFAAKGVDNVARSQFLESGRLYLPHTSWLPHDDPGYLSKYNFLKRQKNKNQTAQEYRVSVVDRYFASNIDTAHATSESGRLSKAVQGRQRLLDEYSTTVDAERARIAAIDRQNGGVGRWFKSQHAGAPKNLRPSLGHALFNSARNIAGKPLRFWKHIALARPGWTLNNVLYNVPASVLSSGVGSLVETAKMISPAYRRKAFDESRKVFGSQVGRELPVTGKTVSGRTLSRWYKFNTTLEDVSRVAAGRAALKKGMSEERALGRVNKYMFDYTTKNWERPLKTVMPFWSWNKSVTKAAVQMPFDRPLAAISYNRVDQKQRQQFESDWLKVADGMRQNGYTEAEIATEHAGYAKKYAGKMKLGDKYYNTPFNAFSEDGVGNFGVNPYLTSLAESASATDRWGRKLVGGEADLSTRVLNQFTPYTIAKKAVDSAAIDAGNVRPKKRWIGAAGSEGYGLTKERQGYDPSLPNYDRTMDPRVNLADSALSFLGKPAGVSFDTKALIENKKLQKMTDEYFALDTKDMKFPDAEAARQKVFDKYGMTADQFYKGILAKYDSEQTKQIKMQKESALADNKSLFDEYSRQPEGTRSVWATAKIRQLVSEGYFAKNPFLKSFDWMTPTTVARADRKVAYESGTKSQKKRDYQLAVKSGDWTAYHKKYGYKTTSKYQSDGKYFKSQESMDRYNQGKFWQQYFSADSVGRKKLLADNPSFNLRAGWTTKQWNDQKAKDKIERVARARAWGGFSGIMDAKSFAAESKATSYLTKKTAGRSKRLTWA